MTKKRRSKIILVMTTFVAIAIIAAIFLFLYIFPKEMRNDFDRLSNESYDTVFLSMYPVDNYEEDKYTYWRAMDIVVTSHEIPDMFTLKNYLKKVSKAGTVTTIYLGVLPEKIDATELAALLLSYPTIRFEVILPYPQIDYWLALSTEECESLLQTYRDFIPPLLNHEMISPYFFGAEEWLIANPANYEDTFLTNAGVSETLMLHSDRDHAYVLKSDTQPSPTASIDALSTLIAQYREAPTEYPDLSGWNIVFLGDSVIGNYTNTTCIPSVTGGLTGANVYNMGFGGGSAAEFPDNNYSLPDIANALIQKDLSSLPAEQQVYYGMEQYIQDNPEGQLCVVINYGLNDYYAGAPLETENPYDIYSYAGAMRTAIKSLKEAYPDVRILLNTPNFTSFFDFGMEYRFDQKHTIVDYVDKLITIAEEMDVEVLDNYRELGINEENFFEYLLDGCHPNEKGRFMIGRNVALKLAQ